MIAATLPAALPAVLGLATPPTPPASPFAGIIAAVEKPGAALASMAEPAAPLPPASPLEPVDATPLPDPTLVAAPQPNMPLPPAARHPAVGKATEANATDNSPTQPRETDLDSDEPPTAPSAPATNTETPGKLSGEVPPAVPLATAPPVGGMPPRLALRPSPRATSAISLPERQIASAPVPVERATPPRTQPVRQMGTGLRREDTGGPELPRSETTIAVTATPALELKSLQAPLAAVMQPALLPPGSPLQVPAASIPPAPAASPGNPPASRPPGPPVTTMPMTSPDDRRAEPDPAATVGNALLTLAAAPLQSPPKAFEAPPPRAEPQPVITEPSRLEVATDRLGTVAIAVEGSTDAIAVRFSVEHSAAATLLAADASRLDTALGASGSRLDALSVDVRDPGNRRAPPQPVAQPPAPPPQRTATRTLRDRYA